MTLQSSNIITDLSSQHNTFTQLLRFGVVGVLAAVTHMTGLYFLVKLWGMPPLIANLFAFMIAFNVSFLGHHYWTFATETPGFNQRRTMSYQTLLRFFVVAISGLALNEGLYYVFLTLGHLNYLLGIFLVLIIVPPLTFVISKVWAFK